MLNLEHHRLFGLENWLKRYYRKGSRFEYYKRFLSQTAQFSAEELEAFQNHQLQLIIHHCYKNIPFYQELFKAHKLQPEHIQTKADLRKLPVLTKQIVNANFDKLIDKKKMNFLCKVATTSGTTGSPAKFVRDYDSINFENAAVWRQWDSAGDQEKRRITLRGEVVVPMSQQQAPFWRYNAADKELLMCGFHLNARNSDAYLQKILEFKPEILSSYPSHAYALAKFFKQANIRYQFDSIFTSSEELSQNAKDMIEDVFQAPVYDWYGQSERVAAIAHCKHGKYHIQEDYSLVELLPAEQGYEVVGTQLFNYVMPLIRYRTQDFVRVGQEPSCTCGSAFRVVDSIAGRSCTYILTPEGYRISAANHIFHGVENILEGQFYQETQQELIIRIIPTAQFSEADRAQLIENAIENTSSELKIQVEVVQSIPRGPNGKFISIISKLDSLQANSATLASKPSPNQQLELSKPLHDQVAQGSPALTVIE